MGLRSWFSMSTVALLGAVFIVFLSWEVVEGQHAPVPSQESLPPGTGSLTESTVPSSTPTTMGLGVEGQLSRLPHPLQRAPLDVIVLFDESTGKRMFTLPGNWPLEDLDEFNRFLVQDQREPLPPYTIQQIAVQGNTVGSRVEAKIRFVITTPNDQTVRIPLGMKEGVLPFSTPDSQGDQAAKEPSAPFHYTGPGLFDLIVSPQDGQYVAVIQSRERVKKAWEPPPVPLEVEIVEDLPDELRPEKEQKNGKSTPEKNTASKRNGIPGKEKDVPQELRHEILLTLWFPLTRLGEADDRLSVSFPQTVSSRFMLSVPNVGLEATVSQGSLLDSYEVSDRQVTLFTVQGLKSNFDMTWRKKKGDRSEDRPVLFLEEAAISARLENKQTIYEAVLPVRSPAGFDRILIRLPPNAVLDVESSEAFASAGDYKIQKLSNDDRSEAKTSTNGVRPTGSGTICEVVLPLKSKSQIVRLRAVQPNPSNKPGAWREISGFDILGAERQLGFLSVSIPPDMRSNWRPDPGLRRVDLPNTPVREGIDARFEFFMQPFLLRAQIVLPETRINAKPEYQVQVNKGQLILNARFAFVVHGSKTEKLEINLPDWRWIDVGPDSIVDLNGVSKDPATNILTIPLSVPSEGSFEIELKAFQPIPPEGDAKKRLAIRLPSPIANWVEPAPLVIVPDDNVELIPVEANSLPSELDKSSTEAFIDPSLLALVPPSRTVGLTRKGRYSLPLRIELPKRQQDPFVFQTESAGAVLVVDAQYHQQTVSVAAQTSIKLLEPENQVTQTLTYSVAYEALDKVLLLIPKSVGETGRWSVAFGDKILESRDVPPGPGESPTDSWTKKRISLPEAKIGTIPLTVRYTIPQVVLEHDLIPSFSVPLVRPADVNTTAFDVNLTVPNGVHVDLHGDGDGVWKPLENEQASVPSLPRQTRNTAFTASQPQDKISLLVSLEGNDVSGMSTLEKGWIQTWLNGKIRMDHGVFLLNCDRESISLRLPPATHKGRISVRLDGTPLPLRPTPKGELTISLTPAQLGRSITLDVWYQIPDDSNQRHVEMELPHFDQGVLVRTLYWQLILPGNLHVVRPPSDWTPEYTWQWNRFFWGRVPSYQMEEIGLRNNSTDNPPISIEANQYLFSSYHPTPEVSFYVLDRSWIVLASSGLALLVGLVLIYFPRFRYAGSLLGLGIALAATIFYHPAPVLLALQASSFGVVLALVACYVYRILNRDDAWNFHTNRSAWVAPNDASNPVEVYSVIVDESDPKVE